MTRHSAVFVRAAFPPREANGAMMGWSGGDALRTVAEALESARVTVRAIDPPAAFASLSLPAAYDVQDAGVALRVAGGARVTGWKLGITSPVKQRVMGIAHPLFGRLFGEGERASGETQRVDALLAPRTEPELAVCLRAAIDETMTSDQLLAAIDWVAPALEITSSRYRAGTRTAVELVADNTSAAAYVLGPRVPCPPALDGFATELVRNGVVVMRGSTADVLDDPLNALSALAAHLATRGLAASAGEVILSGAITDAIPVAPGDHVEARLAGLGTATIRFS